MTDFNLMSCAKCNSKLEEGNLWSWSKIYFAAVPPPGMKWGFLRNIPMRTFRCTVCGYLESYARVQTSGSRDR